MALTVLEPKGVQIFKLIQLYLYSNFNKRYCHEAVLQKSDINLYEILTEKAKGNNSKENLPEMIRPLLGDTR